MELREWALVIFTIIMQMSVGAFVILGGVHYFATRRSGILEADKLSDRALLAIGPLVVFSLLATFFHLGNPLNAPRAITNLGASWLSREILLAGIFTVGGAVFAFLQWRKIGSPALRNLVGLLVAAVGLALIYAMATIYRLPMIPAWDTVVTPVTFFLTAFLLGALAVGAAFVLNYWYLRSRNQDPQNVQAQLLAAALRWIALASIVLLGVQFIVIPLYLAQLAANPSAAAAESIGLIFGENGVVFALRLVLVFLGAGVFAAFIYRNAMSEQKVTVLGNLALLAFALVFVSEVLGRYLFYASMVRIGL